MKLLILICILLIASCKTNNNVFTLKEKVIVHEKCEVERFYYYLDKNKKLVKHGLYLDTVYKKENRKTGIYEEITGLYFNGKKNGLWSFKTPYGITYDILNYGQCLWQASYTIKGEIIASCIFKNDKPYDGTVWTCTYGWMGVKQNYIEKYKKGVAVQKKRLRD